MTGQVRNFTHLEPLLRPLRETWKRLRKIHGRYAMMQAAHPPMGLTGLSRHAPNDSRLSRRRPARLPAGDGVVGQYIGHVKNL